MTAALTITEVDRFLELENFVDAGYLSGLVTGFALAEIRDSKLYRQDYATFEDYCQSRWDLARRRAYQLIEASEVVASISPQLRLTMCKNLTHSETQQVENQVPIPSNEWQALELAKVPVDRRAEVMREAAASGDKITAKRIATTAKRLGAVSANGKSKDIAKPLILCERCQRTGAIAGCNKCKEARKDAKKKKVPAKQTDELKDAFGNVIPKRCRDAWADPWLQSTFDALCVMADEFRQERFADGMDKRKKHYPFMKPGDFIDGLGMIDHTLDLLIQHIKDMRPAGVCPACQGKGCTHCRMSGLVPRAVYTALKGEGQ